jgi:2-amino-4-hydroxy-6-hydroxymethyldihydropteridine diphosphokinase
MRAYLGLGSNVGDRLANLQAAVNTLDLRAGKVIAMSRVYETAPLYVLNQPLFYNAAVAVETTLEPAALLSCVKAIEEELGRTPGEQYGPRLIDIDILTVVGDDGEQVRLTQEGLTLPHPRIAERRFVLEPMRDIAQEVMPKRGLDKEKLNLQAVHVVEGAELSIHRD